MNRIEELENLLKSLEMQSEDVNDSLMELRVKQIEIGKHIQHIDKCIQVLKLKEGK